jgi:hypothetical protein
MLQIYESLFDTAFRFGGQYGPPVALAVLALVGCGIVLRILSRVLGWGGSREN